MKKQYTTPKTEIVIIERPVILAGSLNINNEGTDTQLSPEFDDVIFENDNFAL